MSGKCFMVRVSGPSIEGKKDIEVARLLAGAVEVGAEGLPEGVEFTVLDEQLNPVLPKSETTTDFDETPTVADLIAALQKLDPKTAATIMVDAADGDKLEAVIESVTFEYPGFAAINGHI